jgi:hypothetical protein
MSLLPLWLSIEPGKSEVRVLLSEPSAGTSLKARLPPEPADPRALMMLLEALSLWYGLPLHAVLDADAEDVRRRPEHWSLLLGDAPDCVVRIEWVAVPHCRKHDRFLESMGPFVQGRKLVSFAATGQR